MNPFERLAARSEERREARTREELERLASQFSAAAHLSEAELEGIRRWEGADAAADAIAASAERGRYTSISRPAPREVVAATSTAASSSTAGPRNVLSTLSVIFAILTGVFGIILGFIALAQIRRTGEAGEGNARAGIILGFVYIGLAIVYRVVYALTGIVV